MTIGAGIVGPPSPSLLSVVGLWKAFGGVQALRGVSLEVQRGEIHGLVGANGAGKSTLIRALAGVVRPDAGSILLNGQSETIRNPDQARLAGFAFIHQELNLVPTFTAYQNIALGQPTATTFGLIRWRRVREAAAETAQDLGLRFPMD
jgi:ribose transport system ATP-binding protein